MSNCPLIAQAPVGQSDTGAADCWLTATFGAAQAVVYVWPGAAQAAVEQIPSEAAKAAVEQVRPEAAQPAVEQTHLEAAHAAAKNRSKGS